MYDFCSCWFRARFEAHVRKFLHEDFPSAEVTLQAALAFKDAAMALASKFDGLKGAGKAGLFVHTQVACGCTT